MSLFRVLFAGCALVLFLSACSSSEQADQAQQPTTEQPETPQQTATSQPAETPPAQTGGENTASNETPSRDSGSKGSGSNMADADKKPAAGAGTGSGASSKAPTPQIALGPGLAKVTASIVGVETKGMNHTLTLKIQKVHGYGASTPPLAATNEIKILVKQPQIKLAGNKGPMLLKQGNNMDLTIKHQKPVVAITPAPPSWSLMEVH